MITTQPDASYFGLILGSSKMYDAEAIYFVGDGAQSYAANYWSVGRMVPILSEEQTLFTSITSQTSPIKMQTVRKLNTEKVSQFVLPLD